MSADRLPLNVRCAEALGWEWFTFAGRSYLLPRQVGLAECRPGMSWVRGQRDKISDIALDMPTHFGHLGVPPYGDNSPAGWARTGPLIERYALGIVRAESGDYFATRRGGLGEREWINGPLALHACAAIAEWVAEHVVGGEVV